MAVAALGKSKIQNAYQQLYPKGLAGAEPQKAVDDVAQQLKSTTPEQKAAIRDALVELWVKNNEQLGSKGLDALDIAASVIPVSAAAVGQRAFDVRMPGVPAPVLNAVLPLLEPGGLSESHLTAGLARIHNAWHQQAKADGYLLGERDKQDPVMKMARSFFVQVEVKGSDLALKLGKEEEKFVREYGRKDKPGVDLSDSEALEQGSQKILGEIRKNNQGALDESLRLVSAHLGGNVARAGTGNYLDAVRALPDINVPKAKTSLAGPSPEKAQAAVSERLEKLDAFIEFLDSKGEQPVRRQDVPADLQATYDLFEDQHNRWVKQQLDWGTPPNTDFVRTDELPAKRLALDAAPLRGAYETLLAGLRGTEAKYLEQQIASMEQALPKLENGSPTQRKAADDVERTLQHYKDRLEALEKN